MNHGKAIVQRERADGTTSHLQFLEEANGADEISLSGRPPNDGQRMPHRCRPTAHNIGILRRRVTHVDDNADHPRSALRNCVHKVVHVFEIEGCLQVNEFGGSTREQLLLDCEPQDCDHRRAAERSRVSLAKWRQIPTLSGTRRECREHLGCQLA